MKSDSWRFCKLHFEEGRRTPTKNLPGKANPIPRPTHNSKRSESQTQPVTEPVTASEPVFVRAVFDGLVIFVNFYKIK